MIVVSNLSSLKSRDLVELQCETCGKHFFKLKKRVLEAINGTLKTQFKGCSRQCHENTLRFVSCLECGKSFQKRAIEIQRTKNNFCSHSCSAKYWNAHKTTGIQRSKIEVWLEKELRSLYPLIELHFNRRDAIKAELDIYIPQLKLAFELNGPFHYEPIFGPEKLTKTQTNDKRKFQACLEQGIELCIIDISSISYFKENKGIKFLKIITDIINYKLAPTQGFEP